MPPLKILISGAGISGPALATLLLRSSSPGAAQQYHVTVVERAPELRQGGQQIDLRGQGIPVMRRMGLLGAVRDRTVAEDGIALMDARDLHRRPWAVFGRNESGQGRQALTSEYEIMRGDLVDVLHGASLEAARTAAAVGGGGGSRLEYRFGTHATDIRQLPGADAGASVAFSDGREERFDLVVGADGQGSRTRRLAFGQAASDAAFRPLGVSMAYFSLPRTEADDATARFCLVPGRRFMATRTGDRPVTQGYLAVKHDDENAPEWRSLSRLGVEQQKDRWARLFRGAGWQADRLVQGMLETDDFYSMNIGQVKMEAWTKGRVALLGDAGYCPSPMTGMGTACGLVGAYVLAGEIARHGHGQDLDGALASYEKVLRPFVEEAQKLPPPGPGHIYVETEWGVWLTCRALSIMSALKVDQLMNRLLPEARGGWEVPEYPELNLEDQAHV